MAQEARNALKGYVRSAAKDWVKASAIAAKRGDHKPAKELLMHAGVINASARPQGRGSPCSSACPGPLR